MSVWPNGLPHGPSLTGSEGDLVSVAIIVEPGQLENLLEALAGLEFPINPQIYHHAAVDLIYPDGREESQAVTLVEFPAYAPRVAGVRAALAARDFDPYAVQITSMLDEIHSDWRPLPAPPGAPYKSRILRKDTLKRAVH